MRNILTSGVVAILIFFGGTLILHEITPKVTQVAGSTAFTPVQGKTYYLAGAGVTSSANTVTLSSFTLPDPNSTPITNAMFSGTQYGVLEAQTSKIENITYTGVTQNSNGTATLTGVTRGISFFSPYVSSTTLQLAHAGGATFILSNPAAFYSQFAAINNSETILGTWTFASTAPPVYDADPIWANFSSQALADVSYVNSVVAAGCANGSTTVKGCVQTATARQAASSTINGSTGAIDVLQSSYATDTPSTSGCATSSGGCVVMSLLNGKLSQLWLDLTKAFTWSGLQTFSAGFIDSASSTIAANVSNNLTLNGVSYVFPSSQGLANTNLVNNGSGTLSWGTSPNNQYTYATSTAITVGSNSNANSTTMSLPAGLFTASSTISFNGDFTCGSASSVVGCSLTLEDQSGNTIASIGSGTLSSLTCSVEFTANIMSTSSTAAIAYVFSAGSNCGSANAFANRSAGGITVVNMAAVTGLKINYSVSNGSGNTGTLNNASIIVRP